MRSAEPPPAVVVPAAPGSPWLKLCAASARAEGAAELFVVSERPADVGTHVGVRSGAGFATRANAGLRAAQERGHTTALLLNDDAELLPGSLAALVEGLARPGTVLTGAVLQDWEGGGVQGAGIDVDDSTGRIRVRRREPDTAYPVVDAVSGAAMALRLETWQELGGFEERFDFYFEDIDLCARARGAGGRVEVVRVARVRHRGGGTRDGCSPEAAFHLGRSHVLFARRLGGSRLHKARRVAFVGALGWGWTVGHVGRAGLRRFAEGAIAGLTA